MSYFSLRANVANKICLNNKKKKKHCTFVHTQLLTMYMYFYVYKQLLTCSCVFIAVLD